MTPMIRRPLLTGRIIRVEFRQQVMDLRRHLRGSSIRSDGKAELAGNQIEKSLMAHYGIRYWMRGLRCSAEMVFAGWLAQTRAQPASGRIAEVVSIYGSRAVFALCGLADAWAGDIRGPDLALRYLGIIERAGLRKKLHAANERLATFGGSRRRQNLSREKTEALISQVESNLRASGVQERAMNNRISSKIGRSTEYVERIRRQMRKRNPT